MPSLTVARPAVSQARLALFICAAALIVIGGALRFIHLERQTIFDDEVWTQLRVTGTTQQDLDASFDDRMTTVGHWDSRFLDNRQVAVSQIVQSLAVDEPQWPPFFYLLSYAVERMTSSTLPALRMLSAAFGVAAIAAMTWLAYELFGSRRAAAVTAVLCATSPFLLAYSREARGYALIAFCIAHSSAALIRASRRDHWRDWALYAAALVVGVATYALFVAVIVGHGLWIVLSRGRWRRFLVALLPVTIVAAPWLTFLLRVRSQLPDNLPTTSGYAFWTFVLPKWLYDLALPFYTIDVWNISWGVGAVAVDAALCVAAFVVAGRVAGRRAMLFLAATAAPTVVALSILDARWHKDLVLVARYELPLLLGLVLLVAAMGAELLAGSLTRRTAIAAWTALALVLVASCASSLFGIAQPWWWESWYDASVPDIVRTVNAAPHPLLITSVAVAPEDVFANGLRRDIDLLPLSATDLTRCLTVVVPAGNHALFVLARPNSLLLQARKQAAATVVPVVTSLGEASVARRFELWRDEHFGGRTHHLGFPTWWTTFELWRVQPRQPARAAVTIDVCL